MGEDFFFFFYVNGDEICWLISGSFSSGVYSFVMRAQKKSLEVFDSPLPFIPKGVVGDKSVRAMFFVRIESCNTGPRLSLD